MKKKKEATASSLSLLAMSLMVPHAMPVCLERHILLQVNGCGGHGMQDYVSDCLLHMHMLVKIATL